MFRFISYIICICCFTATYSQQKIIKIEKYGIEEGLSNANITCLWQDKKGFIWVGTSCGLNRYDGKKFKQYVAIGKDALLHLSINSIAEDKDGILWIGTGSGICSFDPLTEKFRSYPCNAATAYVDKQNTVWAGSSEGLYKLDRKKDKLDLFEVSLKKTGEKTNAFILSLLEDSKGRFWLATSYGVKLFNRKTGKYTSYLNEAEEKIHPLANACTQLFEDSKGNVYCGTWGSGIKKWNEATQSFDHFKMAGNPMFDWVFEIKETNLSGKTQLITSTNGGVAIFDIPINKTYEVNQLITSGTLDDQLNGTPASKILKDKENNIWIATSLGLHKIDPLKQGFNWTIFPITSGIKNIIPLEAKHKEFLLQSPEGWWKYNALTQSATQFQLPSGRELLPKMISYAKTDEGFWITSHDGLAFYTEKKNIITSYNHLLSPKEKRTGRVLVDDKKRTWFSVYRSGLRILDPATKKITAILNTEAEPTLNGKNIYGFVKDKGGSIWVAANHYMYKIDPNDLSIQTYLNYIDDDGAKNNNHLNEPQLYLDKNGRMLVIHRQKIYEFNSEKLIQLYPAKGISSMYIENIAEDNLNNFWVSTSNGLYKVSNDFKQWFSYREETGFNGMTDLYDMHITDDNTFLIASTSKLLTFKYTDKIKADKLPAVTITSIKTGDSSIYFPSLHQNEITIPYQRSVEVEVSMLHFSNEKANAIYYKLQDSDDDWKEVADGKIRFEGLPGGKYVLQLRGSHAGVTAHQQTLFTFFVAYPLWQKWWFILLAAILLAAGVYFIYRYRINQLIKEERLRSKIATDLHDDIGATLSSISFYSETIKQKASNQLPQLLPLLDKMGSTSREMVGNMSDIVWAINPKNDEAEMLISRIKSHAGALCALKEVYLKFSSGEEVNSLKFTMEQRRNIFLIFKEALNNALKYSQCTNITIIIQKKSNKLFLSIADNGKGFNPSLTEEGNGLTNMKKRAEDINGSCNIHSQLNSGTKVELSCTIT
jgi:ligand-binding sensor domain-containing protein